MRPGAQALSAVLSRLTPTALGVLLLLSACGSTRPTPATVILAHADAAARPVTIYVARRDWHIDVGFEVTGLTAPLSSLTREFPGVRYLMFGFGDRHYLKARNPHLPNMIAALWPGDGLILVTALSGSPGEAFGDQHVIELSVGQAQARAAQERIVATLALLDGGLQSDGPGPYVGSLYLRAVSRYSAVHTCNTWVAEVLKAAGLPLHSRGVIFAGQLWRPVHRIARLETYSPPQALSE
jgi:hypothetical protein